MGMNAKAVYKGLALLIPVLAGYLVLASDNDWPPFPHDTPPAAQFNLEILVDRSGPMGQMFDGPSMLDASVEAVDEILEDRVAEKDNLALRQFGGLCEKVSTELLTPFGQENIADVRSALADIASLQPVGATTLFRGIMEATADFNVLPQLKNQRKSLIVVTHGVDTCHSDYIPLIEDRMKDSGTELTWLITLDTPLDEEAALNSILPKRGWRHRNVTSFDGLRDALDQAVRDSLT